MKILLNSYKCLSWNKVMRAHWAVQANMVQEAHICVKYSLPVKYKTFKKPIEIIVTAYLKRPIDPDNVCDKLLIDGLKLQKVIRDDTPKYVDKASTRVVKSKKDYTIIEIYEYTNTKGNSI